MQNQVALFIDLLQSSGHSLLELGFAKGASSEDILSIEEELEQKISDDFKIFLSYINGQVTEDFYFLPDQVVLLNHKEIIKVWKQEQMDSETPPAFYDDFQFEDKIRSSLTVKNRIPFACQEGFACIYIDNAPGPKGKIGQIIYLVDECDFVVLADSFSEFINFYIDKMQKGILKFEKEAEGYPNLYRLKSNTDNMDGYAFVEIFRA